jgi:hypothetical protein
MSDNKNWGFRNPPYISEKIYFPSAYAPDNTGLTINHPDSFPKYPGLTHLSAKKAQASLS